MPSFSEIFKTSLAENRPDLHQSLVSRGALNKRAAEVHKQAEDAMFQTRDALLKQGETPATAIVMARNQAIRDFCLVPAASSE